MPIDKRAAADRPIHDLIARRWSPCAFDGKAVPDDDLRSIFEAARWAASSMNEQPWRFIVARKSDPEEFERLLSCLVERTGSGRSTRRFSRSALPVSRSRGTDLRTRPLFTISSSRRRRSRSKRPRAVSSCIRWGGFSPNVRGRSTAFPTVGRSSRRSRSDLSEIRTIFPRSSARAISPRGNDGPRGIRSSRESGESHRGFSASIEPDPKNAMGRTPFRRLWPRLLSVGAVAFLASSSVMSCSKHIF